MIMTMKNTIKEDVQRSSKFKKRAIIAAASSITLLSFGYLLFEQTISNNQAANFKGYTLSETQLVNNAKVSKVQDLDKTNQITFTDEYGQDQVIYVYDSNFHASKTNNKLVIKEWVSNDFDKKYSVETAK